MATKVATLALLAVIALAAMTATTTEAANCSPALLAPCGTALISGGKPNDACCSEMKAQRECLCNYKKNPALRLYVDSANAKHIASSCGVTVTCN